MIAENDNQTAEDFKAGLMVNPCTSIAVMHAGGTHYALQVVGAEFMLLRQGMTFLPGMKAPAYGIYPTSAMPHPHCPEHVYEPPHGVRCAQRMQKPKPTHLRAI